MLFVTTMVKFDVLPIITFSTNHSLLHSFTPLLLATLQKQIGATHIVHKLVNIVQSSQSVLLLYRAIDALNALCTNNSTFFVLSGFVSSTLALKSQFICD
jgi:hypothetical protein